MNMCDPVSIGIASTAMQVYSGNQAAKANANAAEQNAALARSQANAVEDRKARELTQINEQRKQTLGSQRAVMAANGVDSGTGSGLDALSSTYYLAQQDANNVEINAANEKWGYNQQAANYDYQASAARAAGKNNMIGSIIGGAANIMSSNSGSSKTNPLASTATSNDNFFKSGYYGSPDAWQMGKFGKVSKKWFT
jgi:hypothetical protein